ncbi:MAG: endonuclease III domain-containing protein [Deltaproteobacteria bacterium]|nr:endonuclease III domain-containing protein [Deltaproteobacteria bacterium]
MRKKKDTEILKYYKTLLKAFGPQGWWPGETDFEVIIGAILTQNTAWSNVEKAIRNLKEKGVLNPKGLHALDTGELALLIRPAGYFNVKAKRLKHFTNHLFDNHKGDLGRLFNKSAEGLREELLNINGIGPETADSIILYAAGKPEFVVDAYTKRIFSRHGLLPEDAGYEDVKAVFTESLPPDTRTFNEYHALIVKTGKDFCKTKAPLCLSCPLKEYI